MYPVEKLARAIAIKNELALQLNRPVYLAGGAVRDAITGRDIKDYDFFTSEGDLNCGVDSGVYNFERRFDSEYAADPDFVQERVASVFDFNHENSTKPCQLIVLKRLDSVHQLIEGFDLGIAQAAIGAASNLYVTAAFTRDIGAEQMTCFDPTNDPHKRTRALRHYQRLRSKYPTFRFVVEPTSPKETPCL